MQQNKEIYRLKEVEGTLKIERKKTEKLIETVEDLSFVCNIYLKDRSTSQSDIFRNNMLQQFEAYAVSGHSNLGDLSKEGDKLSNKEAAVTLTIGRRGCHPLLLAITNLVLHLLYLDKLNEI